MAITYGLMQAKKQNLRASRIICEHFRLVCVSLISIFIDGIIQMMRFRKLSWNWVLTFGLSPID